MSGHTKLVTYLNLVMVCEFFLICRLITKEVLVLCLNVMFRGKRK